MKTRKFLTSFISFVSILSFCLIPIHAQSSLDPDNDGIPGTNGIDYIIVHTENIETEPYTPPEVTPNSLPGYSIRNVRHYGGGRKPFSISQIGYPGGTISISQTATIGLSYDTSFGFSVADLSASLGFSVKSSYSTTLSYTYKVPSTHNGKKVKSAKLTPWLEYDMYSYDFYFLEAKTGSGIADKPIAIDYVVILTYA